MSDVINKYINDICKASKGVLTRKDVIEFVSFLKGNPKKKYGRLSLKQSASINTAFINLDNARDLFKEEGWKESYEKQPKDFTLATFTRRIDGFLKSILAVSGTFTQSSFNENTRWCTLVCKKPIPNDPKNRAIVNMDELKSELEQSLQRGNNSIIEINEKQMKKYFGDAPILYVRLTEGVKKKFSISN